MRRPPPQRVYADTSVFGGVFDHEFMEASQEFIEKIRAGLFSLVTSALVMEEIRFAPVAVQMLLTELLPLAEIVETVSEAVDLQLAYIHAGIVTEKSLSDALHVALATVSACDMIVSWNFKHIVHFQKSPSTMRSTCFKDMENWQSIRLWRLLRMKTKEFDAAEMKRKASSKIYEVLHEMTKEEQVDYWRKKTEQLIHYQNGLRDQSLSKKE